MRNGKYKAFYVSNEQHDEINAMVETQKEAETLGKIMEEAITLKVPVVADLDVGPTWC